MLVPLIMKHYTRSVRHQIYTPRLPEGLARVGCYHIAKNVDIQGG